MITVPAGGYVVVEFLAKNPGWWFLHCHIDHHLLLGMAIAVAEVPECIVPYNYSLCDKVGEETCDYEHIKNVFEEHESLNQCELQVC